MEGGFLAESHPVSGPRPAGPPPYEPVVRLGTLPAVGPGTSHPNHPILLPDEDGDDDVALVPAHQKPGPMVAPKPRWYRGLGRPAAYVASGIGGAVLVTALYGLLGSGTGSSGSHAGSDAAPGAAPVTDPVVLDRRADTLALAISAFNLRASMYDSRRLPCSGLQRGLTQVEDAWLSYNLAHKDLMAGSDPVRDARDKGLYADVRAVEVRFERSSCARP